MSWPAGFGRFFAGKEGRTRPALRREVLRIMRRQARRNPIVLPRGRQNGLSDSLKSLLESRDRPAKGGATALPSRPQIARNLALG